MAEQDDERADAAADQAAVPEAAGEVGADQVAGGGVAGQRAEPADEPQQPEDEPPVAEPDEPEPDEPEPEEPAVAEPGEAVPETAEPETAEPETAAPETAAPETAAPEVAGEPEVAEEPEVPEKTLATAEVVEPEPEATPVALPAGTKRRTGPRRRLAEAMRPKVSRGQLLAGLLCAVLGFALVVQVQQTKSEGVSGLRQSELVSILDNVSDEAEQLDHDARDLQATRDKLRSGSDASKAAQDAARSRLDVLGVLAGTLPATGPGIELDVTDPDHKVQAADLLDALQELRDAGAEAVQIGSVRVVASTSFEDIDNGVQVDQTPLVAPFRFVVIGDPQTLSAALDIPGGVLESLRQRGAVGRVSQSRSLTISALHSLPSPRYARPVPARSP